MQHAARIANRPRNRSLALGTHMQHAARIHPGNAASARADAAHVHRREAGHVAAQTLTEPGLAGPRDAAFAHQADVVARAAGVGDNGGALLGIRPSVEAARNRRHGRA